MKKIIFIFLVFFSIYALSSETHLLCEYNGHTFEENEQKGNLKGTSHYYFNEKKQSFETDNGISLCNLWKNDGLYKEHILINKKNIYFQCHVTEAKKGHIKNVDIKLKINRISGEYSEATEMTTQDGKKDFIFIDGFCKKTEAKF